MLFPEYQPDRAIFSPCRKYRYVLWRRWNNGPYVMFVGLNPSTADETIDDPTIRRCRNFAKKWGYGALCMTNIFAFRATNPKDMLAVADPVGGENDKWLIELSSKTNRVIAAWGVHGGHLNRDSEVINLLPKLYHLGLTKENKPRHPLYLKSDTMPVLYYDKGLKT